jgi:hypothetical protein
VVGLSVWLKATADDRLESFQVLVESITKAAAEILTKVENPS